MNKNELHETTTDASALLERYRGVATRALHLGYEEYAQAVKDDGACGCARCMNSNALYMGLAGIMAAAVGAPDEDGVLHVTHDDKDKGDKRVMNPSWLRRRAVLDCLPQLVASNLFNLKGSPRKFVKDFTEVSNAYHAAHGGGASSAELPETIKGLLDALTKAGFKVEIGGVAEAETLTFTGEQLDAYLAKCGLTRDNADLKIAQIGDGFTLAAKNGTAASKAMNATRPDHLAENEEAASSDQAVEALKRLLASKTGKRR